jgi:hypothetical protein
MIAVSPSYRKANDTGISAIYVQFHNSMYMATSKLTNKKSRQAIKKVHHIFKTLRIILPYTPKYRPLLAIATKELKGNTKTKSNKFCILIKNY